VRVWPQTDDLSGFFRYNFLNELEGEKHVNISPELALVLEVKIKDDRLYRSQLDGHQKLLAHSDQLASDPIVRTWEQIFGFLKQAKLTYESSGDALSSFLIGQFLDFSQTNCIAKDQLEAEDILRRFMTERERRMAGEIHRYILNHEAWKPNILVSVPKRGDCIEYKLAGCSRTTGSEV
jgi:hypothetical protein